MPSRQDQLHAAQFTVQRLVAALVTGQSEAAASPFGRLAGAAVAGFLVLAVLLAGSAGYGLVTGRVDTGWRDSGAVIVEKETGARYVYRDGRLHPVLNYASAVLLAGGPRTVLARRAALTRVPRGEPLGIPGAPDSLPDRHGLLGAGWSVCTDPGTGSRAASAVLTLGAAAGAGRPLADDGLLTTAGGEVHLIWHGHRHRVREPERVLAAIGWAGEHPVPVAPALLAAVPAGADLAWLPVPGRGRPSPAVRGARIGQVFVVETEAGGRQYLAAWSTGFATISQVQADLLLGDPDTVAAVGRREPARLSPGEYALAPHGPDLVPAPVPGAAPASTPRLATATSAVCLTSGPDGAAEVRLDAGSTAGGVTPVGATGVDRVRVPAGRAAIVAAVPAPGAAGGTLFLVTDLGVRYPLAGTDVLSVLGYQGAQPVAVPADLLWLLPAGPALDPAAAGRST